MAKRKLTIQEKQERSNKIAKLMISIFSVCVPLVGVLMWFAYRKKDDELARHFIKMAGIGFAINMGIYIYRIIQNGGF